MKNALKSAAGHLVFIVSYGFYLRFYYSTGTEFVYPVFLFPAVSYILLVAAAKGYSAVTGGKFWGFFNRAQLCFISFLILFGAPLFAKINIPDPHNLMLRKLELILAAGYVTCIIALAAYLIYRINNEKDISAIHPNRIFKYILVFFSVFYFAVSLWMNYANEPTGDEPEYLLAAHSIVHDRDLDIKNNFENKDYRVFYTKRQLNPQEYDVERNGKLYTFHPMAYSIIITPFYLVAGRPGVTVFTNIMAGAVTAFIFALFVSVYNNVRISAACAAAAGFFLPLVMFANQIATEIMTLSAVLISYFIIRKKKNDVVIPAVLAALLPCLHLRNIPLWLSICLLFIFYNRHSIKKISIFSIIQAITGIFQLIFNLRIYGAVMPKYSGEGQHAAAKFIFENFRALSGMLFDQEYGVLLYTPVYIFFIAGFYIMYKERKKFLFELMVILIPYLILITSWDDWSGGGGAWPRFFIPVYFIFAAILMQLFISIKKPAGTFIIRLLSLWSFIISVIIMLVPWFRWNKGNGDNWMLLFFSKITKIDLTGLFPTIKTESSVIPLVIWIIIFVIFNSYLIMSFKLKEK